MENGEITQKRYFQGVDISNIQGIDVSDPNFTHLARPMIRELAFALNFEIHEDNEGISAYGGDCIRIADHRTNLKSWIDNGTYKSPYRYSIVIENVRTTPQIQVMEGYDFTVEEISYIAQEVSPKQLQLLADDIANTIKNGEYPNHICGIKYILSTKQDYKYVEKPSRALDYEWVELPSKGKCYPVGSPLRNGLVAVKYLTAMDENVIFSDKLRSANKICATLIKRNVTGDADGLSLCSGDKEAIVLWFRKTGYGNQYKAPFSDVEINLGEVKYKEFHLLGDDEGHFSYTFKNGDRVLYRLLPFQEEEEAVKDANECLNDLKDEDGSMEEVYVKFTKSILSKMIVSVNGNTDYEFLTEWLDVLSYDELHSFQRFVTYNSPGLELDFRDWIVFDDSVFYDIR
ncbi:MAG: hypothetical protein K5778_05565 [Bacteroidaceae bacterium]|nr:hypothetical protein [Bacteroidaceae bacterium]